MNIFITGGCKNGKTSYAQNLAVKLSPERYYIATMIPSDDEDRKRIENHIRDREGLGFITKEVPTDIAQASGLEGVLLIDSVTALLANEMFGEHRKDRAYEGLKTLITESENAIFVSDYIFSDAKEYDKYTEEYRKELARIGNMLAKECDAVIELCATNTIIHKGGEKLEEIL